MFLNSKAPYSCILFALKFKSKALIFSLFNTLANGTILTSDNSFSL